MVDKDHTTNRRKYIEALGSATLAGILAGCSGGGDGGGGGDGQMTEGGGGDGQMTESGGDGGSDETATPEPSLLEKAQQEGDVAVATSTSGMDAFINNYIDEFGINVAFFRASVAEVATRVIQEKKAGNITFDVAGGGGIQSVLEMIDQDLFQQLPESSYEGSKARVMMDGQIAVPYVQWALVPIYNKNLVSDPPTTPKEVWELAEEQPVVFDVRDSELVIAARQVFDSEERVQQWVENVGEHATWMSSHFDASKRNARGGAAMSISYAKYVNYDWGGPLEIADVDPWPTTAQGLHWGLINGRPHKWAGRHYIKHHLQNIRPYLKQNISQDVFVTPDKADENGWWYLTAENVQDYNLKEADKLWKEWTGLKSS